ncbi:MAG: UvrD-helicase domain-containing protein [Candidatus Eisenbacteria bacterium]
MSLLDGLNDAQRAAVLHDGGPLLVVAGAGSGKTRVLTARIARVVAEGVPPHAVLAFTFTNRAAREMRERLAGLIGPPAAELWVGTFHATAVRILRREAARLGFPTAFAIYDREDQESVMRGVLEALRLPEDVFKLALVRERISSAKNALVSADEFERLAVEPFQQRVAECYQAYQRALRANGALDFDDLIGETVRLFRDHPLVGESYARRFRHVLVDEYQDTNHAQFRLVHALAQGSGQLFVVGDDDQSIYGWRGADLSNVLEFETAFPGASVIRLEQNYRSTARILRAANAVIRNNKSRKGKTLWCDGAEGEPLKFILAADETEEASRIRRWIESRQARGRRLEDCAVLYRTHAQSRALELEFRHQGMPYQIVGGVSFFQRREIKDLIGYLRLAANPADTVSFWRVWNLPRRGLGPGVRAHVENAMTASGIGPLEGLAAVIAGTTLNRPARAGADGFVALMRDLVMRRLESAGALLTTVLERTGYLATLDDEDRRERDERRGAIEELVAASAEVDLDTFLAEAALVTDADRLEEGADRVLLLTMHNAKGLEFPAVVVAGLEEGLLPHAGSLDDDARLEEERRLFYVALTRAREEVLLTAAAFRRRWDGAMGGRISRFVDEVPAEVLEREESAGAHRAPAGAGGYSRGGGRYGGGSAGTGRRSRDEKGYEFDDGATRAVHASGRAREAGVVEGGGPGSARHRAVGRRVRHEQFGTGVVISAEGEGSSARFTVRFGTQVKKVMGAFLSGGDDGDSA